jgi:DNA-directed RNA polymerase specialized sigma subunit
MQRESQLTREYEQEKKASNHQHEQNIRELNDQLARLKQKEQQNTERIYLLESKERELTSQLGIKESEVGNLDTRLKQALKKN